MQEFDDFFDSPRPRDSVARSNPTQTGRQPSPNSAGLSVDRDRATSRASSHASSNKTVDILPKKSTSYTSDSEDDSDSNSTRNRRNSKESESHKKIIEAKLPAVTKSTDHDYDDSFESDSDDEHKKSVGDSARSNEATSPRSQERNKTRSRSRSESDASRGSRSSSVKNNKSTNHKKVSISKSSHRKKSKYSDDSDVTVTDSDEETAPKSDAASISAHSSSVHSALANGRSAGSRSKKHVRVSDLDGLKTAELSALLQTVLDMDGEDSRAGSYSTGSRRSGMKGRPRSAGGGIVCYKQKKNYSFSNDRVKQIERENQRLLKNIITQSDKNQKAKRQARFSIQPDVVNSSAAPLRPTSASINRNKELQRIDAENLAMLKRLQNARASNSLKRDVQINEYHQQLIRSGAISSASLAALKDCRFVGGASSRPQSGVRPMSGKSSSSQATQASIYSTSMRSKSSRPEWTERW